MTDESRSSAGTLYTVPTLGWRICRARRRSAPSCRSNRERAAGVQRMFRMDESRKSILDIAGMFNGGGQRKLK